MYSIPANLICLLGLINYIGSIISDSRSSCRILPSYFGHRPGKLIPSASFRLDIAPVSVEVLLFQAPLLIPVLHRLGFSGFRVVSDPDPIGQPDWLFWLLICQTDNTNILHFFIPQTFGKNF